MSSHVNRDLVEDIAIDDEHDILIRHLLDDGADNDIDDVVDRIIYRS